MAFAPSEKAGGNVSLPSYYKPGDDAKAEGSEQVVWSVKNGVPEVITATEASRRLASVSKAQLAAIKSAMLSAGWTTTSVSSQNSFWSSVIDFAINAKANGKNISIWEAMNTFASRQAATGGANRAGGGGGSSGPTLQKYVTVTDKATAADELNKVMQTMLGRKATDAEINQYVKSLNKKEKARATETLYDSNGQYTTQRSFDKELFTMQYVLKTAGGDFSEGQLGATLDSLRSLATQYGVGLAMTKKDLQALTKQLLLGNTTEDAIRKKFSDSAAKLFPAWSEYIKQDPTKSLTEIASDYMAVYANLFELDVDQINVSDVLAKATTTGKDGTSTVASLSEFQKTLRKDPKFQTTSTAKQEAAAFGASFARSMGVNI